MLILNIGMIETNKRKPLSGMLVTALVFLQNENYEACKKQIELALKHIDDKLEIA